VSAPGVSLPYSWTITAGSLPPGLLLNTLTGVVSGTPTAAGTYSFTVQVNTMGGGTVTEGPSITINLAPAITTTSLPTGKVGISYSGALAASDGTSPYTWSVSAGSLPAGLSLNSSSGTISGTPTAAGTYSFTSAVTDSVGSTATETLSIMINTTT
jgi:plastocyanin domain-containing protein